MRGNFSGAQIPLQNNFFGVAQLAWELDFWGKYRRATEAARAEMLASEYGMRSVQISLISAVAINYFQLLDFKERLAISQKTLAARDSSLRIIEDRFEEGIIPELDVNQAEIQMAVAESAVPNYKRLIAFTENALSTLLGENPGPVIVDKQLADYDPFIDIPPGLPSLLLERRPDIRQAEALYEAQNARIGVAVAMRFPSISLTGSLGAASSSLVSLNTGALAWNISGNLLGPVFNFNKNKRRVDIERFKAEEYLLQYENTVLNSFREVEDALVEISTLKEELAAREKQVRAAVNAESLSKMRYDRGVTSYLEVLETQRASFDAQIFYVDVYQALLSSYINFYRTLGGGWISPEEKRLAEEAAVTSEE
jgi:multidrug efflux system outer membrane protein